MKLTKQDAGGTSVLLSAQESQYCSLSLKCSGFQLTRTWPHTTVRWTKYRPKWCGWKKHPKTWEYRREQSKVVLFSEGLIRLIWKSAEGEGVVLVISASLPSVDRVMRNVRPTEDELKKKTGAINHALLGYVRKSVSFIQPYKYTYFFHKAAENFPISSLASLSLLCSSILSCLRKCWEILLFLKANPQRWQYSFLLPSSFSAKYQSSLYSGTYDNSSWFTYAYFLRVFLNASKHNNGFRHQGLIRKTIFTIKNIFIYNLAASDRVKCYRAPSFCSCGESIHSMIVTAWCCLGRKNRPKELFF